MTSNLSDCLNNSRQITIFTGAGISTECGIPDYRSPGGIWSQFQPIQYDDFMNSQASRNEDWRRRFLLLDEFEKAQPDIVHESIASLMKRHPANRIITQNIDSMHQKSGIDESQIIELHGTASHALCQSCGKRYENAYIRKEFKKTGGIAPSCTCGGPIKIAVIHFGQSMPQTPMINAKKACEECDLFIAAGSSLTVYPAAEFPAYAKSRGARLVIINRDPTPLDGIADMVLPGSLSDHLNLNHWN